MVHFHWDFGLFGATEALASMEDVLGADGPLAGLVLLKMACGGWGAETSAELDRADTPMGGDHG